ncbi:NUDIX hydrolase [Parvicella tangerina]|uniref:Nudix hydrolase domain-containing protein n=1 Tax=Parvicella tangerina TaxID=2829795 RepID=A0A916JLZ3_9FLAO|nr:NUDIX hydrolase [Parvicella tangerina]CAG5081897.1 hypothetical protein CRYO30217_01756 [Parvicella tangerina]
MKSKAKLVVYKNDELLLLRKKSKKLRYVLLGGTLEKRESPKQACLREAVEEGNVNCELKDMKYLTSTLELNDDKYMYVYYYLTSEVSRYENMEPHKFIGLEWVSAREALKHMRKSDRHVIERFLDGHFIR